MLNKKQDNDKTSVATPRKRNAKRKTNQREALRVKKAVPFAAKIDAERIPYDLSLPDVFIVQQYHDGESRLSSNLTPQDVPGSSHPIVSANMNAVTGRRMAEAMARSGGLAVLPQDMSVKKVAGIVEYLHSRDIRYDTPILMELNSSVHQAAGVIHKRSHNMAVIVGKRDKLIGVVTATDLKGVDLATPLAAVMQPAVSVKEGTTARRAHGILKHERVDAAPVVDKNDRVVGVITALDAVLSRVFKPSLNAQKKLMMAAAVGVNRRSAQHARKLADAGVDVIVVDTAHGYQKLMLDALKSIRRALGDDFPIVAGNVCTKDGAIALVDAGADIVKVNVGPGGMCTTRLKSGVGRPSFSAVHDCARAVRERGKHVWADGGVRHPRDVALYLAAGASRVMIGTKLAGTYESPGDLLYDAKQRPYKLNFGMASARAVKDRDKERDPYDQAFRNLFEEGVSSAEIYLEPGQESVVELLKTYLTGVMSSLTYTGARDIKSFQQKVLLGIQSPGGYEEGTPHGAKKQ